MAAFADAVHFYTIARFWYQCAPNPIWIKYEETKWRFNQMFPSVKFPSFNDLIQMIEKAESGQHLGTIGKGKMAAATVDPHHVHNMNHTGGNQLVNQQQANQGNQGVSAGCSAQHTQDVHSTFSYLKVQRDTLKQLIENSIGSSPAKAMKYTEICGWIEDKCIYYKQFNEWRHDVHMILTTYPDFVTMKSVDNSDPHYCLAPKTRKADGKAIDQMIRCTQLFCYKTFPTKRSLTEHEKRDHGLVPDIQGSGNHHHNQNHNNSSSGSSSAAANANKGNIIPIRPSDPTQKEMYKCDVRTSTGKCGTIMTSGDAILSHFEMKHRVQPKITGYEIQVLQPVVPVVAVQESSVSNLISAAAAVVNNTLVLQPTQHPLTQATQHSTNDAKRYRQDAASGPIGPDGQNMLDFDMLKNGWR